MAYYIILNQHLDSHFLKVTLLLRCYVTYYMLGIYVNILFYMNIFLTYKKPFKFFSGGFLLYRDICEPFKVVGHCMLVQKFSCQYVFTHFYENPLFPCVVCHDLLLRMSFVHCSSRSSQTSEHSILCFVPT